MRGEVQCSKLPPQERSPNFYLLGLTLVPPSLSEMRLGGQWGGAKSKRHKERQCPRGQLWFLSGDLSFFPRPRHLSNHCAIWAGPCAQWQSEYHPSPLSGIRTGAPLSDIERDLTAQFP